MEKTNHKKENKSKSSPLVSSINNTWRNILVQINHKAVLGENFIDKLEAIAYCGSTYSHDDWDQEPGFEDLIRVTISEAAYEDGRILVHCYETDAQDYLYELYTIKEKAPKDMSFFEIRNESVRLKNRSYLNLGFYARSKSGTPFIWKVNKWLDYVNSFFLKSKD